MIIGVDASRAFRKNKTGIEWYVYHLIHSLSALDSKNEYRFYVDSFPVDEIDTQLRSKLCVLRWPFKRFWTQGRLSIQMLIHPPDILIIPASAMPLIHPKKTIVVVHDVGFLTHTTYRSWLELVYLRWSTRYALKHALRIVSVSEWTKQEIVRKYHYNNDNIHVIPIGVDPPPTCHMSNEITKNIIQQFDIQLPFFLSIGRIDPRKNITLLVRSFVEFAREYQMYALVIAGPKGHGSRESIQAIINAQNSGTSIKYLEWISEEEKYALLNSCTAFIFPSLYEGFGIPLIEAQLCRAPVIASSIPALIEISGGAALYFDPYESSQLIHAMKRIHDDLPNVDRIKKKWVCKCSKIFME